MASGRCLQCILDKWLFPFIDANVWQIGLDPLLCLFDILLFLGACHVRDALIYPLEHALAL